jgi:Ner family transcriptional regulator
MPNIKPKIDGHQKAGLTRIKRPRIGWHRADIKAALEKAGWSMAALSESHGYNRGVAGHALAQSYPAAERMIAAALGVEPWVIWPDRYNDYGQPIQPGNPNMVKLSHAGRRRNAKLQVVK